MTVRNLLLASLLLALSFPAAAAGGAQNTEKIEVSIDNTAALQRGAKYFVNYCLSCHSSGYARYQRVGRDLGLTDAMVKENMIFTDKKIGDLMSVVMPEADAAEWFGAAPPDLTLVARSRGADWLYGYLKSFYLDPKRPMGVNNLVFQGTAMPHIMWELQGWQELVETTDANGHTARELRLIKPGTASEEEFDNIARDMVTFLVYLAEPAALERQAVGKWVILFLLLLLGFSYFLYKEYWKDAH